MNAWTIGSLVLFPPQLFSCTMYIICWWEASTRLLISSIRDWFTLHAVWLYLCPGLGLPPNFCHIMFKVSFLLKDSIVHTCNFIIYGILPFNNTVPCTLSVHRFHSLSGTNMQLQNECSVHWDNTSPIDFRYKNNFYRRQLCTDATVEMLLFLSHG